MLNYRIRIIPRAVVNPNKYVSVTTIAEDENGEVELVQIYNQDDRRSPVGPVRVGDAGSKGRGLFATRDVKFGELLFCSKAFNVCHKEAANARIEILFDFKARKGQAGTHSQLVQELIQVSYHNPKKAKEFYKLHSGDYQRVRGGVVDGLPVVDW